MNIGQLHISAPPSWTFYPFDQIILARPDSGVGTLQISTAFRHDAPQGASAADCLALAQQFASREGMSELFDTTQSSDADPLTGAFSFTVGDDFGRAWYRYSHHQLLLGIYQCPRAKTRDAAAELQDAEQIIRLSAYATSST